MGAGVINPATHNVTHIEIKSHPERHTINRAELAAIAVAQKQEIHKPHLLILTDSSFCINTIRNYTMNPAHYKYHLHKDLLHTADQLLRTSNSTGLITHIGKVKSHTEIT